MKTLKTSFFLPVLLFLGVSCKEMVEEKPCGRSTLCTMDFRAINVKLVYEDYTPVPLDSFLLTRLSDGTDLTPPRNEETYELYRKSGLYPVATDLDDKRFPRFTDSGILFEGFINNEKVVSGEYVINFDCCHIRLVSGKTEIVVK